MMKEYGGTWFAKQISMNPLIGGGQDIPTPKPPANIHWPWEDLTQSQKFMAMAGVAVAFVTFVIGASYSLFGPAGKLNIWEKEKYIPSQYKSQHGKMVSQFSKKLLAGGMPLGQRLEWRIWKFWEWGRKELSLPPDVRQKDPHIMVIGSGDTGKSRLISSMVEHDIRAEDRAVVVIDSDGGLIDHLTRWVASRPDAKDLVKRVVLIDPTFPGSVLGYNPLDMPDDGDMQSAASSIVYGFKAMYREPPGAQSQWNQQTANILRNAAMLLMANGKTLADLPPLLNDNDFRDVLLESIEKRKRERAEYITLLETWGQYKKLARTDQWITWVEPILNRVTPMLSDARIRGILTKPNGDIKLTDIINKKKILLVKVAKGQLDQNAKLLGSLVVTGIKQAALSLSIETEGQQNPVALYLDEFDDCIDKDTIQTITAETDKFKIGFVGAIKTLQHLPEDYRNALIISVGTLCCFALGEKDGDMIAPQMFRVDGRKIKHRTIQTFFNRVNTTPNFELIMDEEKLNIDRIVAQENRTFFCYRIGTVAGVFHLRSHDVADVPDKDVNTKIIDKMHGLKSSRKKDESSN